MRPYLLLKKKRKEILLLCGTLLVCLVFLEVLSFFLLRSMPEIQLFEETEIGSPEPKNSGADLPYYSTHPYVGYVLNYDIDPSVVNRYGFRGLEPFAAAGDRTGDNRETHIGIFGGSVAEVFCTDGAERLAQLLSESEPFRDGGIRFSCIALGGWKQPQQLMALNYFLMLGADFDIVLNIDGFNELRATQHYNYSSDISLSYPFRWNLLARKNVDLRIAEKVVDIKRSRAARESIRRFFDCPKMKASYFFRLGERILLNRSANRVRIGTLELKKELDEAQRRYQTHGPPESFENKETMVQECAEIWKSSSELMAALCANRGIPYYHFLQPHSTLPGTKPFSEKEKAVVSDLAPDAVDDIVRAYSVFQTVSAEFREPVHFVDLTDVFKSEPESIYIDNTHFNKKGNVLVAEQVAASIIATSVPRQN